MKAFRQARGLARICAALLLLATAIPAMAKPALWVVRSPTATIYLFGTIHVLSKDASWHYPALDAALAASGELYVEEDDDSPATMQALARQDGYVPWRTATVPIDMGPYPTWVYVATPYHLSSQLDPIDRMRLNLAADKSGFAGGAAALESMTPWMAAMALTKAPITRAGYETRYDVDKTLRRSFKAESKPVKAFETAESQVKLFARLPYSLQLDLLHNVLASKGQVRVETLVKDWQSGDVAGIAAAVNGQIHKYYPDLYQALLVDRNRNWAKQIAKLLEQHGTIFVAVGAGHLAGPDSVQAQLHKLGIETERLQ